MRGVSTLGLGISGYSCSPIIGTIKNKGGCKASDKSALIQFENGCCSAWNAGISGSGNKSGLSPGKFFIGSSCDPNIVLNVCGKVGVGTGVPNTTLHVDGGVSAKAKIISSSYSITTSDFAIFADASSGMLAVTLPSANYSGIIVHVKKIDETSNK